MIEQRYIAPELIIYKDGKIHDLSEFVQSMQVTKSLRNPVGAFNVVLNPTITNKGRITLLTNKIYNEINSLLAVNDLMSGKIDKRSRRHSFLGLSSQYFESLAQFNQQTSRSIVINGGLALPKMLMRDMIANAPGLAEVPEIKSDPALSKRAMFFTWARLINDKNGIYPVNSPEKFVNWILKNATATNIEIYGGRTLREVFDKDIKDYLDSPLKDFKFLSGEMIYGDRLSTFAGPLMNYIYECLDKEFYEVFFDTTTGKDDGLPYNTMTIRTKPFSHKDVVTTNFFGNWTYWEDLAKQAVEIKEEDIFQRDIGKSDYELKNFFRVNYKKVLIAQVLGQFGLNFPMVNVNSIKKYGLRPLEVDSTILVDYSDIIQKHNQLIADGTPKYIVDLSKDNLLTGLLDKRNKIKEWFAFPYYENGTMRTAYNEEITIGRLINLPDYNYYFPLEDKIYKGIKLYATDVTHTFQWGQTVETRATVTSGQPDGGVKKWFDHPDNQFTITPLEKGSSAVKIDPLEKDQEIFANVEKAQKDMMIITEIPNE